MSPRAGRRRPRRGAGWPHPPGAGSLAVSWRGVPESLGEAAGRENPHLEGAGAPVDAGTRSPGTALRGPRARPEGTRWDDHHGGSRRDVGDGHDIHGDRGRGGGLRLRGRRFPTGSRLLRHRELPELRAGARRQRRGGAFHSHAEGEPLVGAELRDDRGASPGLTRVQADIQRTVDAGEIQLPKPSPGTTRPHRAGRGRGLVHEYPGSRAPAYHAVEGAKPWPRRNPAG